MEKALGAFVALGAEPNCRFVNLSDRWAQRRAQYGGPAPPLEKGFFALLGVVRMLRSSSTFCCNFSADVLIITWRLFGGLATCLRGFADDHNAPLLQRVMDTANQSRTEDGGHLGCE